MNRIEQVFERLNDKGRSALIPFIVAGDPDLEATEALVIKMAESGADIIELGVPFSDPLADGPTIQAGSQRALQRGIDLKKIFRLTEKIKGVDVPLVLMTYFNPVFRHGLKAFAEGCRQSGIEGVIIPDLPPEEGGEWVQEARSMGVDTIFLAAPTSPLERIKRISRLSRGFIYYVSVAGVTGARRELSEDLGRVVRQIKQETKKPVAVGFGISTPQQVKEVSGFADGIIVGSAIVKIIQENLQSQDLISKVGDFIGSLSGALKA